MIRLINLPKITDERGNLSFIEDYHHIPFHIKRVYWIYDVPGGEYCGSHAYIKSEEFIVALSGSFDVVLHNGFEEKKYLLNRSYYGLYIPNLIFSRLENFSTNSLAIVLASTPIDEHDCILDFYEYQAYLK